MTKVWTAIIDGDNWYGTCIVAATEQRLNQEIEKLLRADHMVGETLDELLADFEDRRDGAVICEEQEVLT